MFGKQGSLSEVYSHDAIITLHPTSTTYISSNNNLIFNAWQTYTNLVTPFGLHFTLVHS